MTPILPVLCYHFTFYTSMLTIEITAPRVPCAHCARRAARSAKRCDIRMFDIVSVNLFEHPTLTRIYFYTLRMA